MNEPGAYIIDDAGNITPDLNDEAMAERQKQAEPPPKVKKSAEVTNAKK